jgi:hypothetical protein
MNKNIEPLSFIGFACGYDLKFVHMLVVGMAGGNKKQSKQRLK